MSIRLSRRKLAHYYASAMLGGVDTKKLATQLAAYLVESRRTKELKLIIGDIEHQLSMKGVILAKVTSAHDLDELAKEAIINLVHRKTDATNIQITEHLDSSLLGGIKLEFAGSKLDTTIARRLNVLKTNCKKI